MSAASTIVLLALVLAAVVEIAAFLVIKEEPAGVGRRVQPE
jgi:hypothetical protein